MPPGFLLIDKPDGLTSHDVVARVRRMTGVKRVGHAGTLDPFATGLLLVGVGREATREFQKFSGLDKTYAATFVLGAGSDTDDRTGEIAPAPLAHAFTREEIEHAARAFLGPIEQIPPAYAAIKIGGKKMYEAARAGMPLKAPARRVHIDAFDVLAVEPLANGTQSVAVRIACSTGTYIRALARDLGAALGTKAHVAELRRETIGPFALKEAAALNDLAPESVENRLLRVEDALARLAR